MDAVKKRRLAEAIRAHNALTDSIISPTVNALEEKLKMQVRQIHDEECTGSPSIGVDHVCKRWPDVGLVHIYCDDCGMVEVGRQ